MTRQNFLSDQPWDELHEDLQMRTRVFDRRVDDMLSASLYELSPGSPGFRLHMHYGSEEMFFVLSGTPTLRNGHRGAAGSGRRRALPRRTRRSAHVHQPDQ